MDAHAAQAAAQGIGQIEQVALTFGVDWPHLGAQIVSFAIVCVVLYVFAYKPILEVLEERRRQIASGIANAEKIQAELARIDGERRHVLARAEAEGKRLIEEARAAASRLEADKMRRAAVKADQIVAHAHEAVAREHARMLAELKREVGRLVVHTTAVVAGKVLTPEDHRRLAEETVRQIAA